MKSGTATTKIDAHGDRRIVQRQNITLSIELSALFLLISAGGAFGSDVLVSTAVHHTILPEQQNQPTIAVDPTNADTVIAEANEEIDVEACAASDRTTCPFTQGVGVSGMYFSTTGPPRRHSPPTPGRPPAIASGRRRSSPAGAIGTLPNYFENGLVYDSDPLLAFGPRRGLAALLRLKTQRRLYSRNLEN